MTWKTCRKFPAGDLVAVTDPDGRFLGQAFYSAASRIALRMVTENDEPVDRGFWEGRLQRALDYRAGGGRYRRLPPDLRRGGRVSGPGGGLYGGHLAIQTLHPGMERRSAGDHGPAGGAPSPPLSVTLRHDAEVRLQEGLPLGVETVWGVVAAPGGNPGGSW